MTNLESEEEVSHIRLNTHAANLALTLEAILTQFEISFDSISGNSHIREIVEYCSTNETLISEFEDLTNKTAGDFYPQRLGSLQLYLDLIEDFSNQFEKNQKIEMIRLFSDNGNVIVGIIDNSIDVLDYKGDKSWFQDTLDISDPNETYSSPISIARITGNPNIRISIPILINNESKGLFVINYDTTSIDEFLHISYELSHLSILIDPNYENAEGEFFGEVYIFNDLNPDACFNESKGGNIEFKESMFTSLSPGEIGEINLNNTVYHYSFQKVSFHQRVWYLAHLADADFFYASSLAILKNDIMVFSILILLIGGLGIAFSISVSNAIVKNQEGLKKAEEEAEHSGKIINTIFQAIPDDFILFNREGIFLESQGLNKEGIPNSESLIGKNYHEIMPENVVELINNAVEQLYSTKQSQIIEYRIQRPDKTDIFFESRLFYYSDELFATVTRDITEKKKSDGIILDFNKKLEKEIEQRTVDLKKISDKLRTVFETANEGFWEVNNDEITLDINLKMCDILGMSKEEIIGKSMLDFITSEGKQTIIYHTKAYREHGISSSYELAFRKSNNEIVHCIINAAPIFDEFGEKIGTFGMIADITFLKEAEKKLQTQIGRLDSLYELSRLLTKPDITVKEILQNSLPLILKASYHPTRTCVKITYDEYELISDHFKETKWKFSISDSIQEKKLDIEVYYQEDNVFTTEEMDLINEIGDRIKIEILRRETEQENFILANIVENSSDAIYSMNLGGIIKSWNKGAKKMFGYSGIEITGEHACTLTPPDLTHECESIIDKSKKGEQISHFETQHLRKDGKLLDISLNVSPINSIKGEIIGISAIARDFTEEFEKRNQYQEQLLKSSQFKSDFMATMSHELRTPLNSIIGFSDILSEKFYGELNDKQEEFVNNVRYSSDLLLKLINDILDISKIEAGSMKLLFEDIPLAKTINRIEITLKPEFEKKKLQFEIIGLNSKQIICADPIRFKEILFNLVSNAVKYTRKGKITFCVHEFEDWWGFDVTDTGIGIKKEHFALIFKEFARIQSEYTESIEGTGLGLSLTKKLVELHGGNIGFTSKWGQGSTFTFTLPKRNSQKKDQ